MSDIDYDADSYEEEEQQGGGRIGTDLLFDDNDGGSDVGPGRGSKNSTMVMQSTSDYPNVRPSSPLTPLTAFTLLLR